MDSEIAVLEQKLGIRKGEQLPSEFAEEGLEAILGELADSELGTDNTGYLERETIPYSSLASYNKKSDVSNKRKLNVGEEDSASWKKRRENPYIPAPTTRISDEISTYFQPALRAKVVDTTREGEQVQRQLRGLINRISESNFVSIIHDINAILGANARPTGIRALVDLLMGLVKNPAGLSDTFLIIHAALCAAVYKLCGVDFGAVLLKAIVAHLDSAHARALAKPFVHDKQAVNLMSFLAATYTFQVTGARIIFSWIRQLLASLSELNTELLMKLVKYCGAQLRADDPSAIGQIIDQVQPLLVNKNTDECLSARSRVMIDAIVALKNNRVKNTATNSIKSVESIFHLKKLLGGLVQTSVFRANEPLTFSLETVRMGDVRTKWWIPRSSDLTPERRSGSMKPQKPKFGTTTLYSPSKMNKAARKPAAEEEGDGEADTRIREVVENMRLSTPVRRQVFKTILSSTDYVDAIRGLSALKLTQKQSLEIPQVLLHCVMAESIHNPFYSAVAQQLCKEKRYKIAFKYGLWSCFQAWRQAGEGAVFESPVDVDRIETRNLVQLAKFYAVLVSHQDLSLEVLRPVEWLELNEATRIFLQIFLTELILSIIEREGRTLMGGDPQVQLRETFERVGNQEPIRMGLSRFLRKEMADVVSLQNRKKAERLKAAILTARDALVATSSAEVSHSV